MDIELVNVKGEPQAHHAKARVLKRIALAARQTLDRDLNKTLSYVETVGEQEEYSEVLAILEGGTVDARLTIAAIQAADAITEWIDTLILEEMEQEAEEAKSKLAELGLIGQAIEFVEQER
jgi:hypothetical protein